MPVSCQMRRSSSFSRSRVISSSAPNGSSISRSRGPPSSARAIETRWRMPPESSCGKLPSQPSSPTSSSSSRGVGARPAGPRLPPTSSGSSTFCSAVRHGSSAGILEHEAERALLPRLLRRHAEHRDLPPWSARSGRRPRAARSTCRSPTGRAGSGSRRARRRSETFSSAVTVRRSVTKRTVTLRQDTAAGSGTPSGAADGASGRCDGSPPARRQPIFGRPSAVDLQDLEGHDLLELRRALARTGRARRRGRSAPARRGIHRAPALGLRCGVEKA